MPRIVRRSDGLIGVRYDCPGDVIRGKIRSDYYDSDPALLDKDGDPKPERPCSRCGNTFQPTIRRRMLCRWCFDTAEYPQSELDEPDE